MAKNLLIVESPAKAKTINKYLGKDFTVLASYGHVRDLVPREGAVDPERGFAMRYELIEKNEKHVDAIARAAKSAQSLYLATDLDREGEAISWHISEILRERGLLEGKVLHRVTFGEITPRAVAEAIAHPRKVLSDLVNAQQARRALDYLVGFNLSPVLWRKVQTGLSAGRVQSPALRMIVEREEEIERFKPQEYWTHAAQCAHPQQAFEARLVRYAGEKVVNDVKESRFSFRDAQTAETVRAALWEAARAQSPDPSRPELVVSAVESRQRQRRAAAPFITSTLQQEAARKLGFSTSRTMRVAQKLYEGVPLGDEGQVGLITYMRTDSVNLSEEAISELRRMIPQRFGPKALPAAAIVYQSKSKNAQEAHEAIRPTSALRAPETVARFLDPDQAKLYELIWRRTVASQMAPALLNTVSVDLAAGKQHAFRVSGTTVVEPGFLAVYEEGKDQRTEEDDEEGRRLPAMREGERVPLTAVEASQHFTEPPPRYSEASLVKALEEYGIGRPSTYASIIQVLLAREYVLLDSRRFRPTDVGRVVAKFLSAHFSQYVDYDFTAKLEDELDAVSRGEEDWVPLMKKFWGPFKDQVEHAMENVSSDEARSARVLGKDPVSGKTVSVRLGRYGPFAQLGLKEDGDTPKYASLRPGQSLHTIALPQALELFKLPRKLGQDAAGEEVTVGVGRFGPFVKIGAAYASLKPEDDPYTIELPRALQLMQEKIEAAANRVIASFDDGAIQVLNGRFGPYITDGSKNARIPKDREPKSLSRDECAALLEAAPAKGGRGRFGRKSAPAAKSAAAAKTAAAKKAPAKTAASKAAAAKPAVAKKAAAKKAPAKKAAARKATAKTAPARKAAGKAVEPA